MLNFGGVQLDTSPETSNGKNDRKENSTQLWGWTFLSLLNEVFNFGFAGDRVGSWAASFMYQARAGPYC